MASRRKTRNRCVRTVDPERADRRGAITIARPGSITPIEKPTARGLCLAGIICALLLIVAVVFGGTIQHEFVNYDDDQYVYKNFQVNAGLSARGCTWAFTHVHVGNWHPLTSISHMLDCELYGLKPWGHHLSNVLLHAAAVILLFLVLLRMTGDLWPSALAAAVFAVHPLRVESVAWVSERKDVLSGAFFMLTLGAYVWYARRPFSLARYVAILVFFALGLMSKPMLVTLPFVLLLLDYWPLGRFPSRPAKDAVAGADVRCGCPASRVRLVVEKIPLLVLSAASCVATLWAQRVAIQPMDNIPLGSRIGNALVSYVTYLGQFLYPLDLAVFYPHPMRRLSMEQAVAACVLLLAVSAIILVFRRKFPYLLVGWLWYLGMLIPVIGIVQVGSQAMADRYTYLPQIGLCCALAWGIAHVWRSWPACRWACGIGSAVVVASLAVCAQLQTAHWLNSETLWTHALDCTSQNALAYVNLGNALGKRGQIDAAMACYTDALEVNPQYALAHHNVGFYLMGRNRVDEAIAHYLAAVESDPRFAEAHLNLGNVYAQRGQFDKAVVYFRKAVEIKPEMARAHNDLGAALADSGRYAEAIAEYQRALEIRPDYADACFNLGNALSHKGQLDGAIALWRKSLEIDPNCAKAHVSLGHALAKRGKVNEAIAHYGKARKINPKVVDPALFRYYELRRK